MARDIRVLHVDDDPALRDLTAELLERADEAISVESESDPTAVPDRLAAEPVDCLVSDYEMPECDGLDLCRRVRDHERAPDVPLFLFTSKRATDLPEDPIVDELAAHVRKEPGVEHYERLAERIADAVSRHRAGLPVEGHEPATGTSGNA